MDLTDIITISGKPGLYTVVGKSKNNVIVESSAEGKRFPTFNSNKISALADISIYTYDEEVLLSDIYKTIFEKENGDKCISHKENANKLSAYLEEVLPNYDKEQVYNSDIKKLFQWYNLLHDAKKLKLNEDKETSKEIEDKTEDKKEG